MWKDRLKGHAACDLGLGSVSLAAITTETRPVSIGRQRLLHAITHEYTH